MSIQPLIDLGREHEGLSTDDVLTSLLPLFRQVVVCHERGMVAPLEGIEALYLDEQLLVGFDDDRATRPRRDDHRIAQVQRATTRAFEVTGRAEATADVMRGDFKVRSLDVLAPGDEVKSPIFVAGWTTWEHRVGVHDELADIACLGMLLVALAGGLDLANEDDLGALAASRKNLFAVVPGLHPVVAAVAARMIDPDRSQRPQDLASLVERLETYREQPVDFDLRTVAAERGAGDLRKAVLSTLRDRLFDLSKRNRLIWFRSSAQSLNLTEASVPLLMDTRNIRPEQLFTWNPKVADKVLSGKPVALGSVVRWEEAPYANGILDTILSQARRDKQEYGQAQLRLVVAFLRWHDLKGDKEERISSPLLLLPIALTKQRGVRDSFLLQAESTEAEVNPALRQHLKQLYNLDLPATIDLARERVADLQEKLQADIRRTEPAVDLRLQERPRIELIHSKALIRLEAFQRRTGKGNVLLGKRSYAYSYRRRDYRPLGLQVFMDRVLHRSAPLMTVLGDAPAPRMPAMAPSIIVSKDMYALDDSGGGNPYAWDLDLCAVTLANFNYRTMSLVRDYRDLLGSGSTSASFERLFSLEPRPLPAGERPDVPIDDRYLVLPSDGSQVAAIGHARRGESLVIQGPPGTGKSQTITNLIADYVAHGKRVLFVCQKRAAIDVVHARLRQRGLDLLASLIHDSQADKKAFVMGLKETYEDWLADSASPQAAEARRRAVLDRLAAAVAEIEAYEAGLAEPAGSGGPRLREVIERLVEGRAQRWGDDLPPEQRRLVPSAAGWWAARPVIDQVTAALVGAGADPRLAVSPIRFLAPRVLEAVRPEAEVATTAPALAADLRALVAALDDAAGDAGASALHLGSAETIADLGTLLLPVARRGRSAVLRRSSDAAEGLRADVRADKDLEAALAKSRASAVGWQAPLAPDDARAALEIAVAKEASFLKFLDGGWRRVKAAVGAAYSTGPRAVPVTVTTALRQLVAIYDAEAALSEHRTAAEERWGHRDLAMLADRIEAVRKPDDPAVARWRDRLAAAEDDELASVLADVRADLARIRSDLAEVVEDVDDVALGDLAATLEALAEPRQAAAIRAAGPALRGLAAHPEVARAVRRLEALPGELEYAVCAATLDEAEATRPAVARFGADRLAELVARGQALLPELYEADAEVIVARLRSRFLDEVAHSQRSVTGMTPTERERKKSWSTGRRELENEFRKVMRYRAIRDLASGETGGVVAALRPIWLMSPTSVSDTLPLARDLFDVVIYDEASQIPVEEAVPAMHRADQVIVVGDRMQLPPTRFFTASSALATEEDDEVEIGVVLDGDSFLAQSAGRLPSTMLTWHYRSRFESLINFSNAAFYEGRLATIPDRQPQAEALSEIRVDGSDIAALGEREAVAGVDALLARPISVHRMDGSPYAQRTNTGEAVYIAQLVRELLLRETGLTIGIVAFSEAQQTEIERNLELLAHSDSAFAATYEAELVREDDDQVVGLFVKNLENVQGDERDIILMSVCYGPDRDGRMVMNFGPINQEGGEKRLNVIFSRARVHMAIVSSIDADAITNTYNDGANTLRRFLEYAAAVSRGDGNGSAAVMTSFRDRRAEGSRAVTSAVATQLAVALRDRGHLVIERVGQSAFRVDLAVRRHDDHEHRVAVLVDHAERVASQPVPERVLGHPGVLRATGWRVVHVLTKDWHERPDAAIEAVERALASEADDETAVVAEVRQELDRASAELVQAAMPVALPPPMPGAATHPTLAHGGPGSPMAGAAPIQQVASGEPLRGRSVCFTGASVCSIRGAHLSRDDQERLAAEAGMEVRQSVSARLDYLVLSHEDSHSTKAQRAAQLGVRRIAEPAFWEMLGVDVDLPTAGSSVRS